MTQPINYAALAAMILSAYVGKNNIAPDELSGLLREIHDTLRDLVEGRRAPAAHTPAVPVKSSIKPDSITCLECGEQLRMLRRHIGQSHGLTPGSYRAAFGLADDYPLVAPNYAKLRSTLALDAGLGRRAGAPARRRMTARA